MLLGVLSVQWVVFSYSLAFGPDHGGFIGDFTWAGLNGVGLTYGKPVGHYLFNFCDKVLVPVSFKGVNARGEGDYFNGIPADCAAADDFDRPLADPGEASLAEALYVVCRGRCSAAAAAQAQVQARFRERVRPIPVDGWRQTLNAR